MKPSIQRVRSGREGGLGRRYNRHQQTATVWKSHSSGRVHYRGLRASISTPPPVIPRRSDGYGTWEQSYSEKRASLYTPWSGRDWSWHPGLSPAVGCVMAVICKLRLVRRFSKGWIESYWRLNMEQVYLSIVYSFMQAKNLHVLFGPPEIRTKITHKFTLLLNKWVSIRPLLPLLRVSAMQPECLHVLRRYASNIRTLLRGVTKCFYFPFLQSVKPYGGIEQNV